MLRPLLGAVLALALPMAAFAAATVESLRGEATLFDTRLAQGQRIGAPATISTGTGAQLTLKFDDGMQIVLGADSLLRVVDFRSTESRVADRAVFDLLKGSARVVTGTIARDNPKQFFFRTPQASFGVEQPSDFTVALVNPAYVTVHSGGVLASNAAGTAKLAAGTSSSIATSSTGPLALSAGQLPPGASAAMSNLQLAAVSTPVTGGASSGLGGIVGGVAASTAQVTAAIIIGVVAVAAAVAIADSGGDETLVTTTHH